MHGRENIKFQIICVWVTIVLSKNITKTNLTTAPNIHINYYKEIVYFERKFTLEISESSKRSPDNNLT